VVGSGVTAADDALVAGAKPPPASDADPVVGVVVDAPLTVVTVPRSDTIPGANDDDPPPPGELVFDGAGPFPLPEPDPDVADPPFEDLGPLLLLVLLFAGTTEPPPSMAAPPPPPNPPMP